MAYFRDYFLLWETMHSTNHFGEQMFKWLLIILASLFPSANYGFKHVGPSYSVKPYVSIEETAREIAAAHRLCLLNVTFGDIADSKKSPWGLSFTSQDSLTIDQARPMVASMLQALLYRLHHDPVFQEYCEQSFNKPTFGNHLIAFRLAFWDENVDRPLFPYLAQIRFADGQIYYHYANPKNQALQEPIIETLEAIGLTPSSYLPQNEV